MDKTTRHEILQPEKGRRRFPEFSDLKDPAFGGVSVNGLQMQPHFATESKAQRTSLIRHHHIPWTSLEYRANAFHHPEWCSSTISSRQIRNLLGSSYRCTSTSSSRRDKILVEQYCSGVILVAALRSCNDRRSHLDSRRWLM